MEGLEDLKEICVDTDVLIDFLRNKDPGSRTFEDWRNRATVGITAVSAFELLERARQSVNRERRLEEVHSLIQQQQFVLPLDASSADKASEISAELRSSGKVIEIRDLFNASICVSKMIPLLTRNKRHYERVPNLKLIDVK